MFVYLSTSLPSSTSLPPSSSLAAFMAEFHKMAGVINGVAQCFAMEDEECELFIHQQTSLILRLSAANILYSR